MTLFGISAYNSIPKDYKPKKINSAFVHLIIKMQ